MVGGVKRTKIAWIDDLTASIQSKVHCKIYEINASRLCLTMQHVQKLNPMTPRATHVG